MNVLVFLILSLLSSELRADPVCYPKSEFLVSNMPPVRQQGQTPYCYGFAATQTLQHLLCKQNKTVPCKNEISALDVIKKGGGGTLGNGGISTDVFGQVKGLSVAKEECAPFSVISENEHIVGYGHKDKSYPIIKWKKEFQQAYEESQCGECSYNSRLKTANNLKNSLKLHSTAEEVIEALRLKTVEMAQANILVPKKCNNDQIPLPKFKVGTTQVTTPFELREKLKEKMINQTPAITWLCANASNTEKSCDKHVLVVSGAKEVCCGDSCKWQYRLHDSIQEKETWVSEDILFEKMQRLLMKRDKNNNMSEPANLSWLEQI